MADCADALALLAGGMSEQSCHDFREVREAAMCRAWNDMRNSPRTWAGFGPALRAAWANIHADCVVHGGTRPEVGFLAPAPPAPPTPGPAVSAVYQVLRDGRPIGVVVQEADGTLTSCVGGDCQTWSAPSAGGDLPAALSAISGGTLSAARL